MLQFAIFKVYKGNNEDLTDLRTSCCIENYFQHVCYCQSQFKEKKALKREKKKA